MKKLLSIFLILNFINTNYVLAEIFQDELVETILNKNLKIQKYAPVVYEDDLVSKTLNPNLKIRKYQKNALFNETIPKTGDKINYIKGDVNQIFNFENINETIVTVSPVKYYTTRTKLQHNDKVEFVLLNDVKIKNKTYKKGSIVTARVENVSQNSAYGVPSELVIGNFNLDSNNLYGEIEKKGANRSIWLYPTATILSGFFGLGLLLLPIRGGHAKLKPSQKYELNYAQ